MESNVSITTTQLAIVHGYYMQRERALNVMYMKNDAKYLVTTGF